jgi:hypothetical protein
MSSNQLIFFRTNSAITGQSGSLPDTWQPYLEHFIFLLSYTMHLSTADKSQKWKIWYSLESHVLIKTGYLWKSTLYMVWQQHCLTKYTILGNVQMLGGPQACWSQRLKSWGGPVPPLPMVVAPMGHTTDQCDLRASLTRRIFGCKTLLQHSSIKGKPANLGYRGLMAIKLVVVNCWLWPKISSQ